MTSRREFIIGSTLAMAGLVAAGKARPEEKPPFRIQKDGMYYRRLGRTGLFISEVSLGGSPLPDWPLFLQIIERGVNYIDTSHNYNNGNSERQIGQLFKEIGRDKAYVGTKFHLGRSLSEQAIIRSAEGSLVRLKTEVIDVLLIHGADNPEHLTDERVHNAFEKLKKDGKCRFAGLSCHVNHAAVVGRAVDCGRYDMVQVGYNVFDIESPAQDVEIQGDYLGRSGLAELLKKAASKDVGVIAMKTLKVGGRRQDLTAYRTGSTSLQQAMLKWVLENKNVTSAVTEMLNREQMEEDLAVVGLPLNEAERHTLYRHVAENSRDYCRMCGRCLTGCPAGVPIAGILRSLAYWESYGKMNLARQTYRKGGAPQALERCQNCGSCESACPYRIPVRRQLRRAHSLLSA
jgi:predicted aldo/keto reductase-like oxidoreductase